MNTSSFALHGSRHADLTLVCYSMTINRALDAVQQLATSGADINIFEITQTDTFPAGTFAAACRMAKHLLIVQESYSPSLQELIFHHTKLQLHHSLIINSVDPTSTSQITSEVGKLFIM